LARHYFGTVQGVRVSPFEFSFLISMFRAMALAMCVEEDPRYFFATMRASAI
jgi:hypothetical protein